MDGLNTMIVCKCNFKVIIYSCLRVMPFYQTKPTALMNSSRVRQTCLYPHRVARASDHIAYLLLQVLVVNVT